MLRSTVTTNGKATIRGKIRKAAGDKPEYALEGNDATARVHLGTRFLKGVLASKKGKGMSFSQIRQAAVKAALHRDDIT